MKKAVVSEEILRLAIRKKLEQDLINEAGILPKAPGAVQKPGKPGETPTTSGTPATPPPTGVKMAGGLLSFAAGLDDNTFNPIDPNVKVLVDRISSDPNWMETFGQISGFDLDQQENIGIGLRGTYTDAAKGPVPNIVLKKIAQLLLAGEKVEFKRKSNTTLTISPRSSAPALIVLKEISGDGSILYAPSPVDPVTLTKIQLVYAPTKQKRDLSVKPYTDFFARADSADQLKLITDADKGMKQSEEFTGAPFVYFDGSPVPATNVFESINALQNSSQAQAVIDYVQSDQFEELFLTALERMSWAKIPGENPYTQLFKAYQEFHRIVSGDKKVGALAITAQWSLYAGSLASESAAGYAPGKLTQLRENRRIRRLNRSKKVRLTERQIRLIVRRAVKLLSEASPLKSAGEGEGIARQIGRAWQEKAAAAKVVEREARLGLNIAPDAAESIRTTIKNAAGDVKLTPAVAQSLQVLERNVLESTRSVIPDDVINTTSILQQIVNNVLPPSANAAEREVLYSLMELHVGLGSGSTRGTISSNKATTIEKLEQIRDGTFEGAGGVYIQSADATSASQQRDAFERIANDFNLREYSANAVPNDLLTNEGILSATNKALGDATSNKAPFTLFFANNATLKDVGSVVFNDRIGRWQVVKDTKYVSRLSAAESALTAANNAPVIVAGQTPAAGAVTLEEKQRRVAAAGAEIEALRQGPRLLESMAESMNTNTLASEVFAASVTSMLRRAAVDAGLMASSSPTRVARLMDMGVMNPRTGAARAFEELMSLKGTGEFTEEMRATYPILSSRTARVATVLFLGGPTGWLNKVVFRKWVGMPIEEFGKSLQYWSGAVSSPTASAVMYGTGKALESGGRTGTATMFFWSLFVAIFGTSIIDSDIRQKDGLIQEFIAYALQSAASDFPMKPDPAALTSALAQVMVNAAARVSDEDVTAVMFYADGLENTLAFKEYLQGRADRNTPFFGNISEYFSVKNQDSPTAEGVAKLQELSGRLTEATGNPSANAEIRAELEKLIQTMSTVKETGADAVYFGTLEKAAHDVFDEMLTCIASINKKTNEIYVPKAPTTFSVLDASRNVLSLKQDQQDEELVYDWKYKLLQQVNLIDENYQDSFMSALGALLDSENQYGGESWRPGGIASRAEATIQYLQALEQIPTAPEAAPGIGPGEP